MKIFPCIYGALNKLWYEEHVRQSFDLCSGLYFPLGLGVLCSLAQWKMGILTTKSMCSLYQPVLHMHVNPTGLSRKAFLGLLLHKLYRRFHVIVCVHITCTYSLFSFTFTNIIKTQAIFDCLNLLKHHHKPAIFF